MKINFNTNYQVFGDKVVKCTIVCTLTDCNEFMYIPNFRGCPIKIEALPNRKLVQSFVVTAIAKCDPKDEFDLEIGKRIAESRANIKALKIVSRLAKKSREFLAKADARLVEGYNKAEYILAKEESHLNILLGNE